MFNIIENASIRLFTRKPFLHHLFNKDGQIIYTLTFTPKKVNRYARKELHPDCINKAIIIVKDNYATVKCGKPSLEQQFQPFISQLEHSLYNLSLDYNRDFGPHRISEKRIQNTLLTLLHQNRPIFLRKHKIEITKTTKRYA